MKLTPFRSFRCKHCNQEWERRWTVMPDLCWSCEYQTNNKKKTMAKDLKMEPIDTSDEACALVCMLVSNPGQGKRPYAWQKRVNDLIRALRDERNELRRAVGPLSEQEDDLTLRKEIEELLNRHS